MTMPCPGYVTFEYDITAAVSFTTTNNIAIKVASFGSNSRWYAGAGLYRHTHIAVRPATYIPMWGVHVITNSLDLTTQAAAITAVVNVSSHGKQDVTVDLTVLDPAGDSVATATKVLVNHLATELEGTCS